jgi:hypothetical protein
MGLLALTASAADFNLTAYDAVTMEPLPIGPYGNPTVFQYNPPPEEYCPGHLVELIIMVSTDVPGAGVFGMDLSDPATAPISGVYTGDWGQWDPYVEINQVLYNGVMQIDTEVFATAFDGVGGYSKAADSWFYTPFESRIGGYQYDPNFYLGGAVSQPVGNQDPIGADGVDANFLHLVINKFDIPCGEMTWVTMAGLPGLVDTETGGAVPIDTYSWLGQSFAGLAPGEVPFGRIDFVCIPEPASVALLALAGIPAIIRRKK